MSGHNSIRDSDKPGDSVLQQQTGSVRDASDSATASPIKDENPTTNDPNAGVPPDTSRTSSMDCLLPSFGLFWDRHSLSRGGRGAGNRADFLGYAYNALQFEKQNGIKRTTRKQGVKADPYPPLIDHSEQQGVYALYDESYRLLYVGEGEILRRLLDHHRNQQAVYTDSFFRVWRWFSWFGLYKPESTRVAQWYQQWDTAKSAAMYIDMFTLGATAQPVLATTTISCGAPKLIQQSLESLLLTVAEPPHNQQGPKWGEKSGGLPAVQYLQADKGDVAAYMKGIHAAGSVTSAGDIEHFGEFWLGPLKEHRGRWGENPNDVHG